MSSSPAVGSQAARNAVFNVLTIEQVHATFNGATLEEGSFRAEGELRIVQLARPAETHAFDLRLESAANVRDVQPNQQLARAVEPASNGASRAFAVRVPPRQAGASKPVTLLKYCSKPEYAPIPLRVVPRWAFADGADRLELRVAAHPNLKAGLSDVRITVVMPDEVTACKSEPSGEWDASSHTLVWTLAQLPQSATPTPFKADFATGGAPKAGRTGRPLTVQFASETCNLTGLQPRAAPSGTIGKVLQRFVSGRYVINCP